MVAFLLEKGADPHQCVDEYPPSAIISTVVEADSPEYLDVLRLLLDAGVDPLKTATGSWVLGSCISDYSYVAGMITLLMEAGADPNYLDPARKTTALHMAVRANSKSQVQELVDFNADPSIVVPKSDWDWSGLDAIAYAEKLKSRAIVTLLRDSSGKQANTAKKKKTKKKKTTKKAAKRKTAKKKK